MTSFNIGERSVSRVEEQLGPGFAPNVLLPDWNQAAIAPHLSWLAPNYYDAAQDKLVSSLLGPGAGAGLPSQCPRPLRQPWQPAVPGPFRQSASGPHRRERRCLLVQGRLDGIGADFGCRLALRPPAEAQQILP